MAKARGTPQKKVTPAEQESEALRPRPAASRKPAENALTHALAHGFVCDTDRRGQTSPLGGSPTAIVLDASEGFIPLWAPNTSLRWRFRERSFHYFANPAAARGEIQRLFAEAVTAWGGAAPITFKYDTDVWDFEFVMRGADEEGVLASAFFPDGGRHKLELYPLMFTQSRKEQVDTLIHEIGHIFGLRHFFANVHETAFPSEIFGTHSRFSIMNYGRDSELTTADRDDLRRLYQLVWSGTLRNINGTPIRLVRPYHTLAEPGESAVQFVSPVMNPLLPRGVNPAPVRPAVELSAMSLAPRAASFTDH